MISKLHATWPAALGAILLGLVGSADAERVTSDEAGPAIRGGRADVYRNLDPGSLEDVSSPRAIKSVLKGKTAATRIWKTLEHGEKVECLDCIPLVSELLFDENPKNREIGAWWLRRRIFGVFGPGEIYSQLLETLADPGASESRRAYAAEALGEFLSSAGVTAVARALVSDPSARVRVSAVSALVRLNTEGPARELGQALADDSEDVRLAAVEASYRVHVFSSLAELVERLGDDSTRVRRRAAESLGTLRAADAAPGLVLLVDPKREEDATVRAAAVAALGRIADPETRAAVKAALDDEDGFVRDAARIALRRL